MLGPQSAVTRQPQRQLSSTPIRHRSTLHCTARLDTTAVTQTHTVARPHETPQLHGHTRARSPNRTVCSRHRRHRNSDARSHRRPTEPKAIEPHRLPETPQTHEPTPAPSGRPRRTTDSGQLTLLRPPTAERRPPTADSLGRVDATRRDPTSGVPRPRHRY